MRYRADLPVGGIYSCPKFTYVPDLQSLWNRGQSLVVYHHLGMNKPGVNQARAVAATLRGEFESNPIPPHSGSVGARPAFSSWCRRLGTRES